LEVENGAPKKTVAPPVAGLGAGDKTCTIACKMPNGIWLTIYRKEEYEVPILGGGFRKEFRAVATNKPIRIFGPATRPGEIPKCTIVGGYALTRGVPVDVADKWFKDNETSDLVQNQIIFKMRTGDEGKAREMHELRSGLEPLNPETVTTGAGKIKQKDYRWPKSLNPNLSALATDKRVDD
jgi:hypothetical protein